MLDALHTTHCPLTGARIVRASSPVSQSASAVQTRFFSRLLTWWRGSRAALLCQPPSMGELALGMRLQRRYEAALTGSCCSALLARHVECRSAVAHSLNALSTQYRMPA